MERFAIYFFIYMAGIITLPVVIVIFWAMKGGDLTFREFLSGRKDE